MSVMMFGAEALLGMESIICIRLLIRFKGREGGSLGLRCLGRGILIRRLIRGMRWGGSIIRIGFIGARGIRSLKFNRGNKSIRTLNPSLSLISHTNGLSNILNRILASITKKNSSEFNFLIPLIQTFQPIAKLIM